MKIAQTLGAVMVLALVAGSLGTKLFGEQTSKSMPVRYVRAEGVFQHLSKEELQAVLMPLVTASIFEADVQRIQAAVMQLPWVKQAVVERVWPDTIDIKVTERKAYVRWGDESLLTENGELFTPANAGQFQSLIKVTGPKEQEAKTLEIMKGVKTALGDKALELQEFSINDRQAWRIRLKNGLEILLGRTGQLIKLQRFLGALPVLGNDKLTAMQLADLRYPNGFAVSWKPEMQMQVNEWLQPKKED